VGSFLRKNCDVISTLKRDRYEVVMLFLVEQGRGEIIFDARRQARPRTVQKAHVPVDHKLCGDVW
jgi:hypothetical protein